MDSMFRQGDLLFRKVNKIPNGVSPSKSNIIVRGEATGHAHRLVNGQVFDDSLRGYGHIFTSRENVIYIEARKGARVVHEEHGILELEIGFYMVIRQREFLTLDDQRLDWEHIRD